MERKTAADFDQELAFLFDAYVHGDIDRRGFLDRASKFAVGGMTAAMLLDALSPNFAEAQQVPKDDARLETESVEYPSPQGNGKVARLPGAAGERRPGKLPGVLVVHENRGLNPHIEDIARRLALDDFMAFAPDALFAARRLSGRRGQGARSCSPSSTRRRRARTSSPPRIPQGAAGRTGKIGAVGFCYGGGIANMLATRCRTSRAAVPFYGNAPPLEDVAEDQGAAAAPLRRERRAHQCRLAGVRSRR